MKTVLITGGATGIGSATGRLFAEEGYQVAINYYQSQDAALALEQELTQAGYPVRAFQCDIREEAQVSAMFDRVCNMFSAPDVVVNNSGMAMQKMLCDTTASQWDAVFALNARGSFLVCREAVKRMVSRHMGSIVNISSMWGQVGASCEVAYSASKAAVIGLTKALAKEVGSAGIRVNCICPGMIDTAMNREISTKIKEEICLDTPLAQIGTPDQVARAIYFLASQNASFITGQVLGVNGGLVI